MILKTIYQYFRYIKSSLLYKNSVKIGKSSTDLPSKS